MTVQTFLLPDLGEGLTEAEIVRWLVAVGDVVAVDAPVAEVETAKSIVEVPSPYAGVVAELHGAEGSTVDVGKPLISIGSLPDPAAEQYREEEKAGSGNVLIGYGTSGLHSTGRNRRRRTTPPAKKHAESKVPLVMSPLVRKLAKDTKVDLTTLSGTGAGGVITRRDVENATQPGPVVADEQQAGTDSRTGLPIKLVTPMTGFRKAVATTLSRSRREIPEATTWVDVDATPLLDLRESLRTATDPGPGLLALMARFVVAGLLKYPELNGTVDTERDELIQYDGINLGLAAQTDRGLVVPAVLNAHRLTTRGLDAEIRKVTAEAREGRNIGTAGTFTLNNYGSFGVDGSAAIINHPQVAILGVGRIIDRPWVVDGQLAVRKVTQLSFVFDHRVCDGGTAAGFLRFVADAFENPVSVLADL
ncbi:2-oxo acid dehydrogenase subunit E2 [Kribbella sp. NBC_01245]|uniref:dihydrolipoamide acetyltransferase family protein n=1 Tax=Kribbella sp. NBC_01245 TaxID=2903578 RepID=UPI002E2C1A14|nr:dihydrolipoamide acetyltransferase family protein [Kribbella sp. NBC_01245]